jgi:hypothetical protein
MSTKQQNPFESSPTSTPPATSSAPGGPKKSKLGLILGLSIGGGVLLIGAIVTVLLLVLSMGISKADYEEATDLANDVRTPYSKISAMYIKSNSTETTVKNDLDTIKTNRSKLDEGLKKLGEAKAVKNDKEAKELFEKVTSEQTKLNAYLDVVAEYYEKVQPLAKQFSDISYSYTEEAISAIENYKDDLAALDLKQKVNKDYIDQITQILPEYIEAIKAYVNMDYSNYNSSISSQVYDLGDKLTDADTDWKSNVNKMYEEVDFSKALNNLGTYLTDKANGE